MPKKQTDFVKLLRKLKPTEWRMVAGLLLITEKSMISYREGNTEPKYSMALKIISKAEEIIQLRKTKV